MARLVVIDGPWRGCAIALEPVEHILGRDPTCDLAIPDGSLSRRHLRFAPTATGWEVQDLGSHNGTLLNDRTIDRAPLADGDRVIIGRNVLRFEAGGAQVLLASASEDTTTVLAEVRAPAAGDADAGGDLGALLDLADRLITSSSQEELIERLAGWLQAATGAPRVVVFRRRGDSLSAHTAFGPHGREPVRAAALPAAAAVAAGRDGKALWLGDAGGGTAVVPVGAPADLLILLPGVTAMSAVRLRFLACAGHLTAGMFTRQQHVDALSVHAAAATDEDQPIGSSPIMRPVLELLERAAGSDAPVLLLGESGTGKEVLAHALHRRSARRDRPFVAINCAAISASLLESELFGHERGAFTGAVARKLGRFELADKGTLLLDEVAELSLEAQAALLRVTEEHQVTRVGGTQAIPIDVRLVAATHRNLEAEVAAGRFRQDLFFRLSVLVARIPALRERPEDIEVLAHHLLARVRQRTSRRVDGISPEALAALQRHSWPGNIRELRNLIERAVVLGSGERVEVDDLPAELRGGGGALAPTVDTVALPMSLADLERRAVFAALRATGGKKAQAARLLGIDRVTLYHRLRAYGEPDAQDD